MTLDEFERSLSEADPATRAYLVGKLMRQTKPDDVLQFVSPQQLADLWPSVDRYLGKSRAFWKWLLERWGAGGYIVVVDLIAEPAPSLEPPWTCRVGRSEILVDAPQAILVEKLCALLERSELRDLCGAGALAGV